MDIEQQIDALRAEVETLRGALGKISRQMESNALDYESELHSLKKKIEHLERSIY